MFIYTYSNSYIYMYIINASTCSDMCIHNIFRDIQSTFVYFIHIHIHINMLAKCTSVFYEWKC